MNTVIPNFIENVVLAALANGTPLRRSEVAKASVALFPGLTEVQAQRIIDSLKIRHQVIAIREKVQITDDGRSALKAALPIIENLRTVIRSTHPIL